MTGCPSAVPHWNRLQSQLAFVIASLEAYISVLTETEYFYRSVLGGRFQHALEEFLKLIVTGDMKKFLWTIYGQKNGGDTDLCVAGPVSVALGMSRAHLVHSLLRLFPCGPFPPSPLQRPVIQIAKAAPVRADSDAFDVRSHLLLEGHRAEQGIMTVLRDRFELDMDAYDMVNGMTLTALYVGLIATSGSVPISQLEYLLKMSPKPNRVAPTATPQLLTLILDHYPSSMTIMLTEEHNPFHRPV
ncbi:hypothetical protein C7999DRAFT_35885 [Corynascus novoguineensis]|uniref:Uncharacterized protein n=1 Tax=Corynascus novoguineensis TaxID=1126955 RepID=A0AAN7CKH2_9PEZI|nr:hypothetical protein C7999DRAFT_35885 [Corynascus novoguineensis]